MPNVVILRSGYTVLTNILGYRIKNLGNEIGTWKQDIFRLIIFIVSVDLPELLLRKIATRRNCNNSGGFSTDRQCWVFG